MLSDIEIAQGIVRCARSPRLPLLPVWMPTIWSCTASTRQNCPQTCGPR